MVHFQILLPRLSIDFNVLAEEEKDFIAYFCIDINRISPVVRSYAGIVPQGYCTDLIVARIIKIRERILSNQQLARALK